MCCLLCGRCCLVLFGAWSVFAVVCSLLSFCVVVVGGCLLFVVRCVLSVVCSLPVACVCCWLLLFGGVRR